MLRLITSLAILQAGLVSALAQDGVSVRVDCREGIGLIPALWRGIATDGLLPRGVEIKTAHLGPGLVQRAWDRRLSGGEYDWAPLDAVLDSAAARGVDVILPLPVPPGAALVALWPELVYDTAEHTRGRADHYEIWSVREATGRGHERYLEHYERAVWAVYRANSSASVGGPGAAWSSRVVELLVRRCSERRLPLNFLSWRADAVPDGGLRRSVDAVNTVLARYRLAERPKQIVSGWSVGSDSVTSASVQTVRAILSVLDTDLAAVCADIGSDGAAPEALRAMHRLGLVRVLTAIPENSWGIEGIVSLDGEDVIGLFWQTERGDAAAIDLSFSGMPYGSRARVRRFVIAQGLPPDDPMETQSLRLQEPLRVGVQVAPAGLTVVEVTVE